MNRLKRELYNKGILYDAPEIPTRIEHDCCTRLVSVTKEMIITVFYSSVIDPILRLYDAHTLAPIGEQELYKDTQWKSRNPWGSFGYTEVFL